MKLDPAKFWLGELSDDDLLTYSRDFVQKAKQHQRDAAKAQSHADRLRKELRRRKRAAKVESRG